jgi:hypothetical protein
MNLRPPGRSGALKRPASERPPSPFPRGSASLPQRQVV